LVENLVAEWALLMVECWVEPLVVKRDRFAVGNWVEKLGKHSAAERVENLVCLMVGKKESFVVEHLDYYLVGGLV